MDAKAKEKKIERKIRTDKDTRKKKEKYKKVLVRINKKTIWKKGIN